MVPGLEPPSSPPETVPQVDVQSYRPSDPSWDASLADVRHDFHHSAAYHAFSERTGDASAYLVVARRGEQGLAWPYLLRSVDSPPELAGSGAVDVTSVYGYPGPLHWGCEADDPFLADAWRAILATWRAQRVVSAFTCFHPLLGNASIAPSLIWPLDPSHGTGGVHMVGSTVSIDLEPDVSEIRNGYGRDVRRRIKQARRAGVTTHHDEDWRQLSAFTQLYRRTMERVGAANAYFFSDAYFELLRTNLDEHLSLLLVSQADTVLAAGLFTEFDGFASWHLGASDDAYLPLSPNRVLVDDAIQWARDRGAQVLHIGGGRGGRSDSLFWFKTRFSPRRHGFHVGGWVLDRRAYADLLLARASTLEPGAALDRDYFPAYRAPLMTADPTSP